MPTYKGTMFFSHTNYGWSESWYFVSGTIDTASTKFDILRIIRDKLLGLGASVPAFRITDTDNPGVSFVRPLSPSAKPIVQADIMDTPYNAMYVRVSDATRTYRRQLMLRGVADRWIAYDPATRTPILNTMFHDKLVDLAEALRTGNYLMRCLNKDKNAIPKRAIASIAFAPMTGVYTITSPFHGFVTNDVVRIGKTRGLSLELYLRGKTYRLRGPNRIVVTDANTFTITLPGTNPDPFAVSQLGYAVKQSYIFVPIQFTEFQRFAKRNTGRPFFLVRGRPRARP